MAFDDWLHILNTLLSWRVVSLLFILLFWRKIGDLLAQIAAYIGSSRRADVTGLAVDATPTQEDFSPSTAEIGLKGGEAAVLPPPSVSPSSVVSQGAEPDRTSLQSELDEDMLHSSAGTMIDAHDREKAFVRALSDTKIALTFERIYRLIYGSQIVAINLANRPNGLTEADLRSYYESVRASYPDIYSKRSFEEWLAWMLSTLLLVKQDVGGVDRYLSTVRAQEFLKYIVALGLQPKIG